MDIMGLAGQQYTDDNKDIFYVFSPFSIGDFLIAGGLCHALLKKKQKKNCVLIWNDKYANSGSITFPSVTRVLYIPELIRECIRKYVFTFQIFETDDYIYGHFHTLQNVRLCNSPNVWNPNLSFVNNYKENVLGLPLETELIPPLIEPPTDAQKQRLHDDYLLDKKRTIILAPYANTYANLEEAFWEKLASELISKGYVLYTNVSNPCEKVIAGTVPMTTTFQELVYLAEKVNCFIGMRSGIFDLLAFTNARLLYIINSINCWHDDLKLNYNHLNSRVFYTLNAQEVETLKAFMQRNNLSSVDNLALSDKVVCRDLALNYEHLLDKILSAVEEEGT